MKCVCLTVCQPSARRSHWDSPLSGSALHARLHSHTPPAPPVQTHTFNPPETDWIVSNAYCIFPDKMPPPTYCKCPCFPGCLWTAEIMAPSLSWWLEVCPPQIRDDIFRYRTSFLCLDVYCTFFPRDNALLKLYLMFGVCIPSKNLILRVLRRTNTKFSKFVFLNTI